MIRIQSKRLERRARIAVEKRSFQCPLQQNMDYNGVRTLQLESTQSAFNAHCSRIWITTLFHIGQRHIPYRPVAMLVATQQGLKRGFGYTCSQTPRSRNACCHSTRIETANVHRAAYLPQALGLFRVIPSHPARPHPHLKCAWAVLMCECALVCDSCAPSPLAPIP